MYKLSEAAAHDIEQLLDQSILDFGLLQTESYYHDLTHCPALLADNPEMGNSAEEIRSGYRCFPHASHRSFIPVRTTTF
jgi:plasmid stabilization system protein ParE